MASRALLTKLLLAACFLAGAPALGQVTWSPTSCVNSSSDGGAVAWTNPSNAQASDNNRATAAVDTTNNTTQTLVCSSFGISITDGNVITGMTVNIERSSGGAGDCKDLSVRIAPGGVAEGDDNASATTWPTTEATASYGGAGMWNATVTEAEIEASTFAVRVRAQRDTANGTCRIDHVTITVFHAAPTATATPTHTPTRTATNTPTQTHTSTPTATQPSFVNPIIFSRSDYGRYSR